MPELNDIDLLCEFVEHDSQPAFARLVERQVNLVYSVALRYAGNSQDAQDITQAVFIILAKKAAGLRQRKTLTGWLYETTRFTSARLLRTNARLHAREQEAFMQSNVNSPGPDPVWQQVGPLLEEGMSRLGESERSLVALRYFENKSGAEAAALLGIQEWAAHKRTARALEKLRKFFSKRGVHSTTSIIAGVLSAHSIQAAPAALAKTAAAVALAKGATASGSTLTLVKGALKIMAWSTAKTAIVSLIVLSMGIVLINQQQASATLREQNEALRRRLAQMEADNAQEAKMRVRFGRPQMRTISPQEPVKSTNLLDRIKDKSARLTREQVEGYLKNNQRNAASLLAAFRTTKDEALLKEAMEKYPNDPQVAFEAAVDHNLSPEQQRQWLDTFKTSAPDNALANYLSAYNYFQSGQSDQALQELSAAAGKQIDDYTVGREEDDTEAYLSAGYTLAEAKAMGSMQLELPQLAEVKQVALQAVTLAQSYTQAGDPTSAQAALQMAMNVGQNYANSSAPAEISDLVGIAVEKIALGAMDPDAPYGDSGLTVQDEINQITQQREALRSLNAEAEPLMQQLSDQDWVVYTDRRQMFGEQSAMQWVVNRFGPQQP